MYKCPECSQELVKSSDPYEPYRCAEKRCYAFIYGKGFSEKYCKRFLSGGVEVKEAHVNPIYGGEMYEVWFPINHARKGYFRESVQPIVDIIKAKVPATAREYNPDTKRWTIAKEYYVPIAEILKALNFTVKILDNSTKKIPIDVPQDYAENFYRTASVASDGSENITEKLEELLGVRIIASQDLKAEYRRACRRYHPDLGGNAELMAELNRLWSLYNAG